MEYGQPPSWRPDVDQNRAETYRGTVRDALGGLRNLQQLLGSLRVGPRALSSVLPDVRSGCHALAEAIDGLSELVVAKLPDARQVADDVRQLVHTRLDALTQEIGSLEQQSLNAKNRLRLEEAVSSATRDVESVSDLVDVLGEVAWGRTMPLDISEVAREAFRSSEIPGTTQPGLRLILRSDGVSGELELSPRALALLLQHLVCWSVECQPHVTPIVEVGRTGSQLVEVTIRGGSGTGEVRWVVARGVLPMSEQALRIAASALNFELVLDRATGHARLLFPAASAPTL